MDGKDNRNAVPPGIVSNYRGFIAGMFSGMTKLAVGHPFDTIKVRLQTTDKSRFHGPLQCLAQTIRREGIPGLYKGATPPLVGWMVMDSIMLGSLTVYRRLLAEHVFTKPSPRRSSSDLDLAAAATTAATVVVDAGSSGPYLPTVGHGIAGVMAGATVSLVAAPVEHIKARLQVQYAAEKTGRLYSGPIDCARRIFRHHGVGGIYHGLGATLLFRSSFFFYWGGYDVFSRLLRDHTQLSPPAVNFWAGGLSGQAFWLVSYPSDVVKQRIMTDPLGGGLGDGQRRFARWRDAARAIWVESGWRGYWRGFLPCFLRAFPANGMALVVFEATLRAIS